MEEKKERVWKSRKTKIKEFKVKDEDKLILEASNDDLKARVIKELEEKINELVKRIEEINSQKSESEGDKVNKKNIVSKLKRFRKELNDENAIKKRVNLLKIKKRKLKTLDTKIKDRLVQMKMKKVMCFRCRKKGHSVADCKSEIVEKEDNKEGESTAEVGDSLKSEKKIKISKISKNAEITTPKILCYNCGANDHSVHGCSQKVDYANLPFAECFICKEKGHISSNCPTSDKGIYIRGGSCFVCGGKDHLAKNCPQKQLQVPTEPVKKKIFKNARKDNSDNSYKKQNFLNRKRNPAKTTNSSKLNKDTKEKIGERSKSKFNTSSKTSTHFNKDKQKKFQNKTQFKNK